MVGVAVAAAVASCEHAYALVRAHGETGRIGRPVPLTVDGLICASSIDARLSAPRGAGSGAGVVAAWVGCRGDAGGDVAHGHATARSGRRAAWLAVALVGSYELFMTIIRGARQPGDRVSGADPLRVQAAEVFAAEVAVGRVPPIRAIRSRLRVGQSRAQQVRACLAALADGQGP